MSRHAGIGLAYGWDGCNNSTTWAENLPHAGKSWHLKSLVVHSYWRS